MNQLLINQPRTMRQSLSVGLAETAYEVEEAQRLRYQVFAGEMGARMSSANERIDRDVFDPFCEHLVVRDNQNGRVVGTYRILPPGQAKAIQGYYSESEFDMTRLSRLRNNMAEVGRSCVHPDYRDGATIAQLCGELANYMVERQYDYLIGRASISIADGGHYAASVYHKLQKPHEAPPEYRVFPRYPLPLNELDSWRDVIVPPLINGYLRLGAYICGEPAWDRDFNTADLFFLLPLSRLNSRHTLRFTG